MSGSIISAGFALAGVLFGGDGNVSVGDFEAVWLETPEKMPFGGTQRTAVHKLLGGARVIDILGPDESDITFSGYFSGPFAQLRAQQVDTIRKQGQPVPMTWPGDSRLVIVTDFRCSYESGGAMLPYSVTCMVIPPQSQALQAQQTSWTTQAGNDANSATIVPNVASGDYIYQGSNGFPVAVSK